MLKDVRSTSPGAAPILADFSNAAGTPIVVNRTVGSGSAFYLDASDKMVDLRVGGISVKDWGAVGDNSTDDTASFQAAFDYLSDLPAQTGVQGTLLLPRGAYKITSTIYVPSNVRIIGQGPAFACQFVPTAGFTGNNVFAIDGTQATGGYVFRSDLENLTLNLTSFPTGRVPILIQDAYSINFRNVFIYNARGAAVVRLTTSAGELNHISFTDVRLHGESTANAVIGFDILAGKNVALWNCDVEVCGTGIKTSGSSSVGLHECYAERNLIGWDHQGGSSSRLTVVGGNYTSPSASGIAATVRGDNCTVIGGRYVATGGSGLRTTDATSKPTNLQLVGVGGDISDPKNWATTSRNTDVASLHKTVAPNRKNVADNVATTLFTVTSTYVAGRGGSIDVDLFAQLNGIANSVYSARYRIAFALSATNTWEVSAVTEYAKANANTSANYGLTITVTTTTATDALSVKVTADSSGALGAGVSVDVCAEATLWQQQDNGGCYLAAA